MMLKIIPASQEGSHELPGIIETFFILFGLLVM